MNTGSHKPKVPHAASSSKSHLVHAPFCPRKGLEDSTPDSIHKQYIKSLEFLLKSRHGLNSFVAAIHPTYVKLVGSTDWHLS